MKVLFLLLLVACLASHSHSFPVSSEASEGADLEGFDAPASEDVMLDTLNQSMDPVADALAAAQKKQAADVALAAAKKSVADAATAASKSSAAAEKANAESASDAKALQAAQAAITQAAKDAQAAANAKDVADKAVVAAKAAADKAAADKAAAEKAKAAAAPVASKSSAAAEKANAASASDAKALQAAQAAETQAAKNAQAAADAKDVADKVVVAAKAAADKAAADKAAAEKAKAAAALVCSADAYKNSQGNCESCGSGAVSFTGATKPVSDNPAFIKDAKKQGLTSKSSSRFFRFEARDFVDVAQKIVDLVEASIKLRHDMQALIPEHFSSQCFCPPGFRISGGGCFRCEEGQYSDYPNSPSCGSCPSGTSIPTPQETQKLISFLCGTSCPTLQVARNRIWHIEVQKPGENGDSPSSESICQIADWRDSQQWSSLTNSAYMCIDTSKLSHLYNGGGPMIRSVSSEWRGPQC